MTVHGGGSVHGGIVSRSSTTSHSCRTRGCCFNEHCCLVVTIVAQEVDCPSQVLLELIEQEQCHCLFLLLPMVVVGREKISGGVASSLLWHVFVDTTPTSPALLAGCCTTLLVCYLCRLLEAFWKLLIGGFQKSSASPHTEKKPTTSRHAPADTQIAGR